MQIKNLFAGKDTDRAVSPVIGVILMVAITVILAAVIGTFVLGLGDQVQQTSPNANWDVDYDAASDGSWELTHEGGDDIPEARLGVSTSGATNINDGTYSWATLGTGSDNTVTAGDAAEFNSTANYDGETTPWAADEMDGATVRLIWTAEGGDSSSTLTTWEGPDV